MRVVGGCIRISSSTDRGPTLTNISMLLPRARLAAADSHANTYNGHLQFSHALFFGVVPFDCPPQMLASIIEVESTTGKRQVRCLGCGGPRRGGYHPAVLRKISTDGGVRVFASGRQLALSRPHYQCQQDHHSQNRHTLQVYRQANGLF